MSGEYNFYYYSSHLFGWSPFLMDTSNMRIRTTYFGMCMICEIIQVFWPYLPRNPNSEDTPIFEAEIQLC